MLSYALFYKKEIFFLAASKLRKKRSRSKSRSSGNKKGPKGKKSADAEFDECSLET